jgi:AraC-like DNA-binding protein
MTIHDINIALQTSCITVLGIACIFFIRHARTGLNTWAGIGFTASVICYLLLDTSFIQRNTVLYFIALTGSISVPVVFFLLTKAIFDDHFKPTIAILLWFALEIIPHSCIYLKGAVSVNNAIQQISSIVAEIVSLGFVVAGLYTAVKTRKGDLIESRLKFRNILILVTAAIIGITLIVESLPIAKGSVDGLQILQRSSILLLTLFFLLSTFEIKPGFFFKEPAKEKTAVVEDKQLREKLESLVHEAKIYRKEGLTIRGLAELMNEQEYRVRRLINGELGFRNFNDFLNKYRVNEACEILSDPSQNRKTILEIAYSLGYQSIGPFNKAFKEIKDTTPTAYRKSAKPGKSC